MEKFAAVRRVLFLTLGLNLISSALKLGVGVGTGSLSLVAGGFDALLDASSNFIGLLGIRAAARPPDATHPYGHRKFETLAALVVAAMILVMIFEILRNALERLAGGGVPVVNPASFLAVLVALGFEGFTSFYERRQGSALKSEFLLADAAHTQAHVLVDVSLLVGLTLVGLGFAEVDAFLAMVIAAVIAKVGWDIVRSSSGILADAVAVSPVRVIGVALSVRGVKSAARIRSHGASDDIRVDLEVSVSSEKSIEEAHAIADRVERRLKAEIQGVKEVLVHIEPQPEAKPELLTEQVRALARREGARIHEIRIQEVDGRRLLDLHLEVEEDQPLEEAHRQATLLEERIKAEIRGLSAVFVHIEPLEVHPTEYGQPAVESERVEKEVARLVREMPGLSSYDSLVVRRVGERLFLSLNCILKDDLSVEEAHDLASEFELRLREWVPGIDQVLVHLEPPKMDTSGR